MANRTLQGFDGVRGLLALSVAYAHAWGHLVGWNVPGLIKNAPLAVDIFFVMSGIVLFQAYETRFSRGLNTALPFALTRFFRLWPLHFLTTLAIPLICWMSIGLWFPDWFPKIDAKSTITNLTLTQSIGFTDGFSWNQPSWSISIELIVGTVVAFLALRSHSLVLIAVAAATYTGMVYYRIPAQGGGEYTYFPFLTAGSFRCIAGMTLGAGLWQWFRDFQPRGTAYYLCGITCAVLILVPMYSLFLPPKGPRTTVLYIVMSTIGLCLLPQVGGAVRWVFELAPFRRLGELSYSIYLVHTPVILALTLLKQQQEGYVRHALPVIALLLTYLFSCWTYAGVERPAIQLGKRWIDRLSRPQITNPKPSRSMASSLLKIFSMR